MNWNEKYKRKRKEREVIRLQTVQKENKNEVNRKAINEKNENDHHLKIIH